MLDAAHNAMGCWVWGQVGFPASFQCGDGGLAVRPGKYSTSAVLEGCVVHPLSEGGGG